MGLVVKTVETNLTYNVYFKSPQLELSKEDRRLNLIGKILKAFEIRLNDIKVNIESPSNNILHFSKLFGRSFFDVSLGYEEYTVKLRNPENKNQISDLCGKLAQIFKSVPVSRQMVHIQQHFATEGDATNYLKSLNPSCPTNFKEILHQSGVHYTLKIPSHELTTDITLVGSLFVPGGLYFSEGMDFFPNLYDFKKTFKISNEYHEFILKELGLKIKDDK